jgi:LAGLIDADG DNA endonuclease family
VGSRGQRSESINLTARARSILIGTLLGDARLQPTGRCRARLRLEHGLDQADYLLWKVDELSPIVAGRTTYLERVHPMTRAVYRYIRHQSLASATYGQLWRIFYPQGTKRFPQQLSELLTDALALAVWYMDDGYYFPRERECYLYLGTVSTEEAQTAQAAVATNFALSPRVLDKRRKGYALYFSARQARAFAEVIGAHVLPYFRYKLPFDPVTTDRLPGLRNREIAALADSTGQQICERYQTPPPLIKPSG